jgi:peptide/nickel transport system permease protein
LKVFFFFLLKKIIILFIVLLITLLLTIFLLGSTFDKIVMDSIRLQVFNSLSNTDSGNPTLHQFKNFDERQKFVEQQIKLQSQSLGLDEPWYSPKKLFNSIIKIVSLDLGKSRFFSTYSGSSNVNDLILEKMPYTILLFTSSSVTIVLIGLFFGAYIASKEGKKIDRFTSGLASISQSVPVWWFSMMMLVSFSFFLHIFPSRATPLISPGDPGYIFDLLYRMALPFISIVIIGFASFAYYVKYIILRILDEDYIKTLKIMGIPQKSILYKHALKNAGPQLTTMLGLGITASLGGSVLVEQIFDWPGIGNLFYNAIILNDSPLIIGLVYFFTLIYLLTRLILDVCFTYFDPRIKSEES